MTDYNFDNCPVTNGVLTTSYTYGTADKEYVFSCKGRPFAALVSPNLPTPTSTLLDYDFIRKLRIKMTDVQCRKFQFGGHKMRILGRVSSAVQCVQGGRITGSFHVKGLVVTDLYELLDTHCVAGTKMREKIAQYDKDWAAKVAGGSTDAEDDESTTSETMISSSSPVVTTMSSSSGPTDTMTSSSASAVGMMTSSSASAVRMTTSSSASPSGTRTSSAPPPGMLTSSSSAKMSPYMVLPAACNRVGVTETSHAAKLKVPERGDLFWEDQNPSQDPHYWLDRCEAKEGETLKLSHIDGQPRVINLLHHPLQGSRDDQMLRVGNWGGLTDPARHQAQHVLLARIRREESDFGSKDRVCNLCSYLLGHRCDLYYPAMVHCKECCVRMQEYHRERERERADREETERRQRRGTKGHANL